mmetsp:Transcript_967/g.2777  ORF Transcript_967/g.2777 Transcript_967/m.2777 type:complete len:182 (-) Transcript_967:64-609(-)
MCSKIGVDPLVSSKGFWAEMLGIGDFYYELGVQIIDVCMSTRDQNGGLMDLAELCARVGQLRAAAAQPVTPDDVRRAVEKLRVLGNGFAVVRAGARDLVVSVPVELNQDHADVLTLAQGSGFVTPSGVARSLRWRSDRVARALSLLLKQGMAWVDRQAEEEQYWFLTMLNCKDAEGEAEAA